MKFVRSRPPAAGSVRAVRQLVQDPRSGVVEILELPNPVPSGNQVLVRNSWSLISAGTEAAVSSTAGKSLVGKARDRPDQARQVLRKAASDGIAPTVAAVRARLDDLLTPGYASAGIVEAVGPAVRHLRAGDAVACVGANQACHAERVAVAEPLCVPLPEGLDARWGAFGAVGAIAGHGVRTARVEAGAVVVVIGLGLVGQIAAQLSTAAGARVVGIDPAADRVALATRLGAVGGAVLGSHDPEGVARGHSSGRGADAVLVAAATGDSGPVELAAELARDRATVCVVGDVGLQIPRAPFYEKELELRISRSYGPGRYDASYEREGVDYPIGYVRWTERRLIEYFLEEARDGRVRLEELVTHEFPIERGVEAYEALSSGSRMAILLRYAAPEEGSPTRTRVSPAPRSRSGRLRVGLIGPGLFARSVLLPRIVKLDAELVAVAGTTPARAFGVARRWGARYAARAPEELIGDDSIDAVVIATRHDTHAELAAQAIERGKAVFCEKPLAIDHDGLDRLRPLLEGGARFVVDFNRGFSPAATQTREHFAGRADPLSITYRVNAGFLERDHWLRDRTRGGGRLVGEACHFVDLASWLVGRSLSSVATAALGPGPMTLEDDSFVLSLDYEDGSIATVTYVSSGHARMPKERVEVLGGGRSAVIDDFRRVDRFPSKSQLVPDVPRRTDKGHAALLERAFRFFTEGGAPPIPYERILETTEATLIAREALDTGRREPVPLAAR